MLGLGLLQPAVFVLDLRPERATSGYEAAVELSGELQGHQTGGLQGPL